MYLLDGWLYEMGSGILHAMCNNAISPCQWDYKTLICEHYTSSKSFHPCFCNESGIQLRVNYCIALHCIALHCIALHCIALRCVALRCVALRCVALRCVALRCVELHCIALHCIALHCIALHCIALHCIALHCIALHCTVNLITKEQISIFTNEFRTMNLTRTVY